MRVPNRSPSLILKSNDFLDCVRIRFESKAGCTTNQPQRHEAQYATSPATLDFTPRAGRPPGSRVQGTRFSWGVCFFYPQTSRLKLLVKPCPGLGFRCRCFARATPLPRRRPPTDNPPLCSLAGMHLASLQLAALQTVAASGAGGFCFREAYYHMYPISTDDLIYARGHYPWTVDGGGSDWNSARIEGVVRSPTPPSPPPLPPTGRGVGMGGNPKV